MFKSKIPLWKHQETAIHSFLNSGLNGFAYFMGMGTGKTKTAIDTVSNMPSTPRKVLIVATKTILSDGVWEREIEKNFVNPYRILVLDKGTATTKSNKLESTLADFNSNSADNETLFVISHYNIVWRDSMKKTLYDSLWDLIILDEAHKIKNAGSSVSKFFAHMSKRAKYRLCLTGTPCSESPLDIYAIYRFMNPNVFGTSYRSFQSRYAVMGGYGNYQVIRYQNLPELYGKVSITSYTCMSDDVLDLPEDVHKVVQFPLEGETKKIYQEMKKNSVLELEGKEITPANVLSVVNKLSQIASGFIIDDQRNTVEISRDKISVLMDVIEEIDPSEQLVVFYRYSFEHHQISESLKKSGISYMSLNGNVNELPEWKRGESRILLVQFESGSEGVDLSNSRYIIYYSKTYSNTNYQQSLMRIRRPTQKSDTVFYTHIVCKGTVDEDIHQCLMTKQDLFNLMVQKLKEKVL